MGQIIFPDILDFNTGVANNLEVFGKVLRTKSVITEMVDWQKYDFGDRDVLVDSNNNLYIAVTETEQFSVPTDYKAASLYVFALNDGGKFEHIVKHYQNTSQLRTLFTVERIGTTLNFTSLEVAFNGEYTDDQAIYVLTHVANYGYYQVSVFSKNLFGRLTTSAYKWCEYWKPKWTQAKIYEFLYKNGTPPSLVLPLEYSYVKRDSYWLSPIIDMGPYIDITGVGVNESTVPNDMQMKIYTRVSSVAPSGEPTPFQDTAGNTLQYYPHDDSWNATDWEEVANGGTPNVIDRFIQVKVSFEVV